MDLSNIKLIVSEVDGIITEDNVGLGEMAMPMFKMFCIKDFEAINELKKHWDFVFLSSDAAINMSTMRKKNIPFYHAERNKLVIFKKIISKYSLTADQVMYIGRSYSDIECMQLAGFAVCPDDAVPQVINVSDSTVSSFSGFGVLSVVYELLYSDLLRRQRKE
jgi:3-deoxy-D-manno-octulosonate 8-phosphate phosphatase (KDO 8-P phosphatase)